MNEHAEQENVVNIDPPRDLTASIDAVADEVTRLGECAERLAGLSPDARGRVLRHLNDLFSTPRAPKVPRGARR